MSRDAHVDSIEGIRVFRTWLCKFVEEVNTAFVEADGEIHKAARWLSQDQHAHWKSQCRRWAEQVTRAKIELEQKQRTKTPAGGRYSCVDEKKALALAKRRHEEAEQKLANVKRWIRQLDEEVFAYKGQIRGLMQATEGQVPAAIARLDNILDRLSVYTSSTSASESAGGEPLPSGRSMARPLPTDEMLERHARLRARTPAQETGDQALAAERVPGWLEQFALDRSEVETAAGLAASPAAPDPGAHLLIALSHRDPSIVYMERREPAAPSDSGWYLGPADQTMVAGYATVTVKDVLVVRPEWQLLFELAAGHLVVMTAEGLITVLGSRDEPVWPVSENGVEGETREGI